MNASASRNSQEATQRNENKTIFVGNMPYKMTWRELKDFFSQFGSVAYAKCGTDIVTKKRKGFGFVEFKQEDDAYKAKSAHDDQLYYQGRTLRVKSANQNHSRLQPSKKTDISRPREDWTGETDSKVEDQPDIARGTYFDMLNDDCLAHILLFLDPLKRIQLERVNKAWKRCSDIAFRHQRHMTLRKQFKSFQAFTEHMLYKVMARCSNSFTSLDISLISSRFGNKALEIIASSCPGLESLDISGSTVNNKGVEKFTATCHNLKSLRVSGCQQLSEKGFWYLFHNCQQLQFLDCCDNRGITGKCFKYATSHFEHLNATCCAMLGNEGVLELSQRCPNLKYLDFRECNSLDVQTLQKLFQSCPKLTDIHLGGLDRRSSVGVVASHVIRNLADPSIVTRLCIDNSGLTDSDVQFVCSSCPHLVELDISCNHLTDSSIIQLSSLHHLQVLSICHLFNITSSSLIDVVQLGKLKVLRAHGCKKLENSLFMTMAKMCSQLEELDIAGVVDLSDITISTFVDVLRSQPHRKLVIYVWGNDFHQSLPVTDCPNLLVVSNFRHLYMSHSVWLFYADECPHNIVMPAWDNENDQDIPPACLIGEEDSDDSDGPCYDFLLNDDPVEAEYFECS